MPASDHFRVADDPELSSICRTFLKAPGEGA